MPYKSELQRKFFNSPAGKEKIGKEEVEEWNKESKGQKNLPEKTSVKDNLRNAIKICDSKTYIFKAYNDFEDYDMSELLRKDISRYADNIRIRWNKKDNTYSINAEVKDKHYFESSIEGSIIFKNWVSK